MKYLLDTNICIALIRRKSPAILNHLLTHQPGEVGISSISLAELSFGVEKSTQVEQNKSALQQFLLALELAEFDQPAAFRYGKIRAELERSGQLIGSMELLIGAHAVSLDAILVTKNIREFQRINGLILEDWMDVTG